MGSITLPPLNPDTAILGHWRPENKFNILVNHLILLFKFFIYKFKNHNFAINIYKFKLFTMSVQKVEQKIAFQNNSILINGNQSYMHSIYKIAATAIMTLMKKKSLSHNSYHNPARQSFSICMLLQSGVLSAKKSQTTSFFLCSSTLLSYFLQKQLCYTFCRTLH